MKTYTDTELIDWCEKHNFSPRAAGDGTYYADPIDAPWLKVLILQKPWRQAVLAAIEQFNQANKEEAND